jgi:helix-turn-helix protein
METVKQYIAGESSKKVFESDVDNYHWAIAFFTNYTGIVQMQKLQTYNSKINSQDSTNIPTEEKISPERPSFDISLITATLNKSTIIYIFQQIESFYERKQWARLTHAIKAAKETVNFQIFVL